MSKHLKHSKNILDSASPKPHASHLTEEDKKKLELGDQMEHAHGRERESLQRDIQSLDKKSR